MEVVLRIVLIVVGVINGYPAIAAFFPQTLHGLYGLSVDDTNLMILLRHRAILFGLLGGFLILSSFNRDLYLFAVIGGLLSMLAYSVLGFLSPGYNAKIRRVIVIDIAASIILAAAYALYFLVEPRT